jgi:hypothetical protein
MQQVLSAPPQVARPRQSRSITNVGPITFKGDYGGHAFEINGTITV